MPPGTLYLRLDAAQGPPLLRGAPVSALFCVLGVGGTRYRSATANPDRSQWHENFQFTTGSEPALDVECWTVSPSGGEQLLGSASVAMDKVTAPHDATIAVPLRDTYGGEVATLQLFHAFRPLAGAQSTAAPPAMPAATNPYNIDAQPGGSSSPAALFGGPPLQAHASAPAGSLYPPPAAPYPPPTSHAPAATASPFPPSASPPPGSSQPQQPKMASAPAGVHHYAPPPGAPAGYVPGGASSSSGLPPGGYPSVPHPGQFYTGKPAKYGKPSKYMSGMGGVAGGVAAGALTGLAVSAMMGGFRHKHKGFGFKGPKGFGFKGPKGFGFKGPKGFDFGGKGFGGCKGFGGGWSD